MSTKLTPRQIIVGMSGLIITMLLAQLDNMIVAPALPTIVGELGGLDHLSWVVTAYILASTVSIPIWGKLGDLYGHKRIFMISIVLFLIGSALCGISQDMTQLILSRAFQGVGGGGLMVGILSVVAMMVPPRERGKYVGIMMAVMPVAMIAGPLIGGFITDNLSWRWAFYVNLPLGILALVVIWTTLNLAIETKPRGEVKIDWWGISLIIVWISALVLMITWGGGEYSWASPQIIGLGALALVGFLGFVFAEHRAEEPVIPLKLFTIRNFTLATLLGFVAGFSLFGGLTFLPQFQQFVQGESAMNSGLLMMPLMISAMATSLGGGQIMSRTGHYKSLPIIGSGLLTIGLYLFSTMDTSTTTFQSGVYMIFVGAGLGFMMQVTSLIAQNSVSISEIGAATGTATFTRNLGGALGVSMLGAIYASLLNSGYQNSAEAASHSGAEGASTMTPSIVDHLPEAVKLAFQQAVVDGTHAIFLIATVVAAVGFILAWFIKQVPLRKTMDEKEAELELETQLTSEVESEF